MTKPAVITVKELQIPGTRILFPGMAVSLRFEGAVNPDLPPTDADSINIARSILPQLRAEETLLFANPRINESTGTTGTLCKLVHPSDTAQPSVLGLCRATIRKRLDKSRVEIELVSEDWATPAFSKSLLASLQTAVTHFTKTYPGINRATSHIIQLAELALTPQGTVDMLASVLPLKPADKLVLLQELDPLVRCTKLIEMLTRTKPVSSSPSSKVQGPVGKPGAIATQAHGPEADDDFADVKKKLQNALPFISEEGRKVITRELKRISKMPSQSAELNVTRNYLETLADLPWANNQVPELTPESIKRTAETLDAENYGLKVPKKRLVEYVTVSYLKQQSQKQQPDKQSHKEKLARYGANHAAPIILLVGPPGVGKTSLAKSVAEALDRQLYRLSLGGVRDEAEIRGHRRTYIGAMPGVIVQGLQKAGTMNPVLVLDEIDKVASGINSVHGDPSSALLEVLDPAQNNAFRDHYVGFPIDLSHVTFIATANTTDTIPRPLLDRMEVIRIEGYTYYEKEHIAREHLWPKQLHLNGVGESQLHLSDDALRYVIMHYTRESGVRELERQLSALCRGWAVRNLEYTFDRQGSPSSTLEVGDIQEYLGVELFHDDVVADETDSYEANGKKLVRHVPGVVNGLAYMGSGMGGILVLEANVVPGGTGALKLTGQLGDVMNESANIALSWVRANSKVLNIDAEKFTKYDFHLHAPAGAIPKDGPSAGAAMTVCFVSLLTDRKVPRELAMTGEMTLRGKVLPVGGIREKMLGAHLAGVHRVILPFRNKANVDKETKDNTSFPDLQVQYAKYIWDVFSYVWPEESSFWQAQSHL